MWTRRQQQQFTLGAIAGIVMFILGTGVQVGDWKSEIVAWVLVFISGLVAAYWIWLTWHWQREWRIQKPLKVTFIDGGLSVDTSSRSYEWESIIPIQNQDDERSVMTKEVYLNVRRGNRIMSITPVEAQQITLAPKEPRTVVFHFKSVRGLEPSDPKDETESYEYATVVIVDSNNNVIERPLGTGKYPTKF